LARSPDVVFGSQAPLPAQPDAPAALVAWPYADWSSRLQAWPEPVQVQVQSGSLVKGDRDPQPYSMAVLARIEPGATSGGAAEAIFERGAQLLGHVIEDRGETWLLRTLWRIDRPMSGDVTMFVHLIGPAGVIANVDGDAGDGLYPIQMWRAGDLIVDERRVPLPANLDRAQLAIEIGLYDRSSGARLKIMESNGPRSGDALQLGAPGGPGP
jgi:hypothetical protein